MSLFIAQSFSTSTYQFASVQSDVIAISTMDTGLAFATATTVIEAANCTQVNYARTQSGPTAVRLDALVHSTGFTAAALEIVVFGVPSNTLLPNGTNVSTVAGQTWMIGQAGSPLSSHIAVIYDVGDCAGTHYWVDKQGGGTTSFPSDVILYHELSHAFHFATGAADSEPLAETDENDQRDARSTPLPHRNTASHNGGCGGAPPPSCCIVASLSTGSHYSEEIQRFRYVREHTLRSSMVGNAFFEEFFYRYYGFSPEVTRLIGQKSNLRPLIKDSFVVPLLAGVEFLMHYADNEGRDLVGFLHRQANMESRSKFYKKDFLDDQREYLKIARSFDRKMLAAVLQGKGKQFSGFRKLLKYISSETIRDEYIDWSLVSVIELWVESAQLLYSGKTDTEIDFEAYEKIVNWIALMPISTVWKDLSRLETELELQSLEQFMFDPRSKDVFSKRLIERYPRYSETVFAWVRWDRR